jgi:hypothetical protein
VERQRVGLESLGRDAAVAPDRGGRASVQKTSWPIHGTPTYARWALGELISGFLGVRGDFPKTARRAGPRAVLDIACSKAHFCRISITEFTTPKVAMLGYTRHGDKQRMASIA